MSDPRIGTVKNLPALTVGGNPREPGNVILGIGGDFVVALDYFGDQTALVEELRRQVESPEREPEKSDTAPAPAKKGRA